MSGKRRVFGAAFKAKVVLAAARGDRTTAQMASQFGIHTISPKKLRAAQSGSRRRCGAIVGVRSRCQIHPFRRSHTFTPCVRKT